MQDVLYEHQKLYIQILVFTSIKRIRIWNSSPTDETTWISKIQHLWIFVSRFFSIYSPSATSLSKSSSSNGSSNLQASLLSSRMASWWVWTLMKSYQDTKHPFFELCFFLGKSPKKWTPAPQKKKRFGLGVMDGRNVTCCCSDGLKKINPIAEFLWFLKLLQVSTLLWVAAWDLLTTTRRRIQDWLMSLVLWIAFEQWEKGP